MVEIKIIIPNAKLQDFKEGFLKANPIALDEEGNLIMSENAWIKRFLKDNLMAQYRAGKEELRNEQSPPVIDENIIS